MATDKLLPGSRKCVGRRRTYRRLRPELWVLQRRQLVRHVVAEPKSADGPRTVCFPASTQLKREAKASRKSTEAQCTSFADYCK